MINYLKEKKDPIQAQLEADKKHILDVHNNLTDTIIERQKEISEQLEPYGNYFNSLKEWIDEEDKLAASVQRARDAGVPEERILHNYEEGEKFFMM